MLLFYCLLLLTLVSAIKGWSSTNVVMIPWKETRGGRVEPLCSATTTTSSSRLGLGRRKGQSFPRLSLSSSSSPSSNDEGCFAVMDLETAQQLSTSPTEEMMDIDSKPLSIHTFSGQVERALKERFNVEEIRRILQSLHLLEHNYEHVEWFPSPSSKEIFYKQHAPSYVPGGLTVRPFWRTNEGFTFEKDPKDNKPSVKVLKDWCELLEHNYPLIRQDFDTSMKHPQRLKEEGNNVWAGALTEDASSYGVGWKTLVLYDRGTWDANNVALFPQTSQFLHEHLPKEFAVEIFFAQMDPNSSIKPHSDFTNFVLTSHLALDIPQSGENKCRLTVGDITQEWINGKVTVFDTSLIHDAVNESNQTRYILMFRLWHPDLTRAERQALQFIYDCLVVPELATATTSDERFLAEQQLQMIRSFPSNQLSESSVGGGKKNKGTGANRRKKSSGFGSSSTSSAKKKTRQTKATGFGSK